MSGFRPAINAILGWGVSEWRYSGSGSGDSMKSLFVFSIFLLVLGSLTPAPAAELPAGSRLPVLADSRYSQLLTGEPVLADKARADTVYLMGGDAYPNYGDFEDENGLPSWDGWYGVDLTARTDTFWSVSDYHCANLDPPTIPNHAWWCGSFFTYDCGTGDFQGYGNDWDERVAWVGQVADNQLSTTVTINAVLNHDVEPGYDYLYLQYENDLGAQDLVVYNGATDDVVVNESFVLDPDDYLGPGENEIHLHWRVTSDSGWSDEDCLYPSQGAAQIDLISVYFDQGEGPVLQGTEEDCDDNPLQWFVSLAPAVGDFSHVWPRLNEIDRCKSNSTPLVAFIDDGNVVPGTGGYSCTSWCYGPGGYIVNPEGGLIGPEAHIHNEVWSSPIAWPEGEYEGAHLEFDIWPHLPLDADSPGIFYFYHVRSTESADPADLENAFWRDHAFVNYGWAEYLRFGINVTSFLVPDRQWVQLALMVVEYGWVWGWTGTDGTPAPYFDNVTFKVFDFPGPTVSTREIDIAQDNFPEIGEVDYANLGRNHVRFDMARNISLAAHLRNDPGDSIFCDVQPVRTGAVLNDLPKMYYKISPGRNPDLFAAYRTIPLQGWIYGDTTYTGGSTPISDRYNFDLPDSSSLFPGDKMHYYFEGQDNVGGDIGTTLLPADTTGFDNFFGFPWYNSSFIVHALPSIKSQTPGDHPPILFWNDFANRGGEEEWNYALHHNVYWEGLDYDTYYTNGPSSGVGNGLGGRATTELLSGYETILYTCGDLSAFTISNGDFTNDPGDDVGVLDSWLQQGGKNILLTGDDLVFDLNENGGAATLNFENTWIKANFIDRDLRPLIGNQSAPTVMPLSGPVTFSIPQWIAYGSCLGFNTFDAVEPEGTSVAIAEFMDNSQGLCLPGQYPHAAGLYNHDVTYDADIVYLPYDFCFIYTGGCNDYAMPPPDGSVAARTLLLMDILAWFGHIGHGGPVDVPELEDLFSIRHSPNPFNPKTTIRYHMPRSGHLMLRIFDVRGRLIRTLIDEPVPAGPGTLEWLGRDDRGRAVSSGLYFYETRVFGETIVNKMTLLK